MLVLGTRTIVEDDLVSAYMPSLAATYWLGPFPVVNGRLTEDSEGYVNNHTSLVIVEAVIDCESGVIRWAIRTGVSCLTRGNRWITEKYKSGKQLKTARFHSAEEAIKHYFAWKKKALKWIKSRLDDNPDTILNLPERIY